MKLSLPHWRKLQAYYDGPIVDDAPVGQPSLRLWDDQIARYKERLECMRTERATAIVKRKQASGPALKQTYQDDIDRLNASISTESSLLEECQAQRDRLAALEEVA